MKDRKVMIPEKYLCRMILVMFCAWILGYANGSVAYPAPQDQRETAISLFQEGQYAKALPLFTKLNYDFPYDYLLKYFTGACLVETGNYGVEAEKNLILASSKEVPSKVFYYLGMIYHARGSWNSAQRYYNRFKNNADSLQVRELMIDELADQCYRQINPFVSVETADTLTSPSGKGVGSRMEKPVEIEAVPGSDPLPARQETQDVVPGPETVVSPASPSSTAEIHEPRIADSVTVVPVQSTPEASLPAETGVPLKFFNFRINDKVTYLIEDMFQEEEALREFRLAESSKSTLDSILGDLDRMRKRYHETANPIVRDSIARAIQDSETRSILLKGEVATHYRRAATLENEWWKDADFSVYQSFAQIRDSVDKLRMSPPLPVVLPEAIVAKAAADTIPDGKQEVNAVESEEGKGDEDVITYRIQIGAYGKTIPSQKKVLFDKISKIRIIDTYVNDEGLTVYTTGNLTDFKDAVTLQNQVRLEGIKDAFVIAMKGGKRIPLPK